MLTDVVMRRAYAWEFCPAEEAAKLLKAPGGLLSPAETAQLARFASEKRRLDWLAGRAAAKKVLGARLAEQGRTFASTEIEILNDPSGAPRLRLPEGPAPAFSISHCAKGGLCAVLAGAGLIGVDFEPIAAHGPAVLELFIHRSEPAPLDQDAALWQTRLWTAKEAVLKLLGTGLACDPRDVRWFAETGHLELAGAALKRWRELGSPAVRVEHAPFEGGLVAVAFTLDRERGTHG